MKIHEINMYQEFDAPVDMIWEVFNDHVSFGKMMGLKFERITDSKDLNNPNGIGSVRLIKTPLLSFEETIAKSEKQGCIEYRISKGTPLNHHYGKMQFKSLPGGKSALNYNITIGSKIPLLGAIVKSGLQTSMQAGLKKYAARLKK